MPEAAQQCRLNRRRPDPLTVAFGARLAALLTVLSAIVAVSVVPGTPRPGDSGFVWLVFATPTGLQKTLHVIAYGLLAAVSLWMLDARRRAGADWIASVILIAVGFGALLEWAQTFVPGRFGTLADVLLNATGVILGAALYCRYREPLRTPARPGSRPSGLPSAHDRPGSRRSGE